MHGDAGRPRTRNSTRGIEFGGECALPSKRLGVAGESGLAILQPSELRVSGWGFAKEPVQGPGLSKGY